MLETRRSFLHRVAALGGTGLVLTTLDAWGRGMASAASGPPQLEGTVKGKRVVILGAGLAGMTAAFELSKLGYVCQIIEAREFAGGRCQTARKGFRIKEFGGEEQVCEFDTGLYINHGPWRIPYHHRSTLHYTKEFEIPLEIMVNDNDAAWVYFEGSGRPLANQRIRQVDVKADLRGHVAELLAKATQDHKLDDVLDADDKARLIDYLIHEGRLSRKDLRYGANEGRGYRVTPGAGIDPGPGILSDPLGFKEVLGSHMGYLYSAVHEFTQQATMFQPVGGMDQIAKAFERRVRHLIRYQSTVDSIRQDASGVTITYRTKGSDKPAVATADYCLCTLPLSVLGGIDADFEPGFKSAIKTPAYMPVGKIGLQMGRRFWEEDDHIYGGHIHTNFRGIGDISLPSAGWQGKKGVLLGYYNFEDAAAEVSAMSLKERIDFALSAGEKIFPDYRKAFEHGFSVAWHRVPHNLGGWAEWTESARASAYARLCAGDRRVLLAGEHMSYLGGWQAGAIESSWQQISRIHQLANA